METYKANRNNNTENMDISEKSEKEKKQESTEKAVDLAATVALDAYTGGKFSQVKNTVSNVPVVGKRVNDTWNKTVSGLSKNISNTPLGDAAKKLDDSGLTDAAKQGYDAFGGAMTGKGSPAPKGGTSVPNVGTPSPKIGTSSNNSAPLKTRTVNTQSKSSVFSKDSSFITDNIMSFKMSPMLKLKLIGIGAAVFLIFCIIIAITGQKDQQNLAVTNTTVFSESSIGAVECTATQVEQKLTYVGGKNISDINLAVSNSNADYIINNNSTYNDFKNTFLPSLENNLSNMEEGIVLISFNINDLTNFDLYVNDYKELISKYLKLNFYVISLGPVEESLTSSYGIDNNMLAEYNGKLRDNFTDIYIDTYNYIGSGFSTVNDGFSYDNETNVKLHNFILNSITGSGKVLCSGSSIESINESQILGGNAETLSGGETLLVKLGEEYINNLNTSIVYDVNKAGKGNGLAPAIAAYDLVQGTLIKGVIIPYHWGGGRDISVGVNPSWGELKTITLNGNKYQSLGSIYPNGLDSLGLVNWAIKNGGCSGFTYRDAEQLVGLGKKIEPIEAVSGDLIIHNNEAIMVLRNTGSNLIVAESNYKYGVIFNTYGYSVVSNYDIIRMSDYYEKNCK